MATGFKFFKNFYIAYIFKLSKNELNLDIFPLAAYGFFKCFFKKHSF